MALYRNNVRITKHGFTLTELSIVLGVAGLVLAAIWAAISQVSMNYKSQKAVSEYLLILNGYRSMYVDRQPNVATLTDMTCVGVASGFFPADMLPGVPCITDPAALTGTPPVAAGEPTYPQTPWGGTSYVQVMLHPTSAEIYLSIRFANLTQAACIAVANASTNVSNTVAEAINGTEMTFPPIGTDTLPTLSQIVADCNLPSNSNFVYIGYSIN